MSASYIQYKTTGIKAKPAVHKNLYNIISIDLHVYYFILLIILL